MAKMAPLDILNKSLAGSGQSPGRIHNAMDHLLKTDPKFKVIQAGNTLFSYYNLGNGVADITMDTAATPQEIVKDVKEFAQAMKANKFHTGRFHLQNPQIERVLKMAGLQYKIKIGPGGQHIAVVEV
jgi:hypothetical protein